MKKEKHLVPQKRPRVHIHCFTLSNITFKESKVNVQKEKDPLSKESVQKALKLSYFRYLWLKLKSPFTKTAPTSLEVFDSFSNLQMQVFNEDTMYRMFFDIQRLKKVVLNHESKSLVFSKIRFDLKDVLWPEKPDKSLKIQRKQRISHLQFLPDEISKELWTIHQRENLNQELKKKTLDPF